MLFLSRRNRERIRLQVNGITIWVSVEAIKSHLVQVGNRQFREGSVRLGIEAPPEVVVLREEVIQDERHER